MRSCKVAKVARLQIRKREMHTKMHQKVKIMSKEKVGIIGNEVAKVDGKVDNKVVNAVAKKSKVEFKFDYTYKPVATGCKEFKVAERAWWKKTSDLNLCNMFDLSVDALEDIKNSDKFKQAVFNLMSVQFDASGFEKWINSWGRSIIHASRGFHVRMKLEKSEVAKFVDGVKLYHTQVAKGAKVKVMKQRCNPYATGVNNRNQTAK